MTSEAVAYGASEVPELVLAAAGESGQVVQLADGRAGYIAGLKNPASGDRVAVQTEGIVTVIKTASIVILDGGRVYWDHSANKAHFKPVNDRDFFLGTAYGDASSASTSMKVMLNKMPQYVIDSREGVWTTEATLGLGTTLLVGGGVQLAFDAVAEAAQAAMISERTVPIASNPILEARLAIFDKGDNAALDFDIGLASASHATDFQAVAEFVSVHFDGNALDLLAQSDDGTTDVAPADTTVDAVDDTYFEVWIDCRDPSDCQIYIDGVLVLGATVFTLAAATGPLKAIVHMEKTSDDTVADVRLDFLKVRIAEQ